MTEAEDKLLVVGEVLKPWGYRGEVKVQILTDFPTKLSKLKTVYLGPDARVERIERARLHSGFVVIKFEGYDTPEVASVLRGQVVRINAQQAERLPPGHYFHHQIIGLHAVTTEGETLGEVEEILETGANDVYVVRRSDGSELLLPAIEDVIKKVDLQQKQIIIRLMPGLLE